MLEQSCRDGWITFDRVTSETLIGSIRPDVVGYCGSDQLLVEVAYSSFCGVEKRDALANLGICAIELDVSALDPQSFDPEAVRHAVLNDISIRAWLVSIDGISAPIPEPSKPHRIREYLTVVIAQRNVQMKILPWGQIALSYLYGDEVCRIVRNIARRYGGQWDARYKNWRIDGCFMANVESELRSLQDRS